MASLLDRIRGQETVPEKVVEIPDEVPQEWGEEFAPDPTPGEVPKLKKAVIRPTTSGNVTPALKKKISAEIEAYIEFAALPIVLRDPTCGQALHEQAKPIADAIANLLARNPELAHKFLATGVLGDWLKLLSVTYPVLKAVFDHHITKTKDEEEDGGFDFSAAPAFRPGS